MDYLLDTNVLIIYSRSANIARRIERDHQLFDGNHDLAISIVTIGEINSFSRVGAAYASTRWVPYNKNDL